MNRIVVLLTGLGLVLISALVFVLLIQPNREEVEDLEVALVAEEEEQVLLRAEIERLREVRMRAPDVEAELIRAGSILPREPALPSLIRQLQAAADDAGVSVVALTTTRPSEMVELEGPGLARIGINLEVSGSYFGVIDFLRRAETPSISPRGLLWNDATVLRVEDQYPQLQILLNGEVFARFEPAAFDEPGTAVPDLDDADDDPSQEQEPGTIEDDLDVEDEATP